MLTKTFYLYKTSFAGLSRETWLLSLVMFINRSGTMVVPFMTLYLTGAEMNRTLSEAGLVLGLFGLGSIAGAYAGGRLSDKYGFQNVQVLSLLCGGMFFILLGQIHSFPLICVCTFLLSLFNEAFRPANSAAIVFYSKPENRTRAFSLSRLAINLGWAVGGSIGGLLAAVDYELLFWVDGFTNIGAAVLLWQTLKPEIAPAPDITPKSEVAVVKSAYADKVYIWFILLVTVFAICFFQLFTTIPKFFRDSLNLSVQFIGFTMALNGILIVLLEMVVIYQMEKKQQHLRYIGMGMFICAAAFLSLLLPFNGMLVALIMTVLITVGEIAAMPFMSSFWTLRSNESNRGQYAALFTIAWGVAQTAGPFLASLLADATNFSVLFIVMAALLVFTGWGFLALRKSS